MKGYGLSFLQVAPPLLHIGAISTYECGRVSQKSMGSVKVSVAAGEGLCTASDRQHGQLFFEEVSQWSTHSLARPQHCQDRLNYKETTTYVWKQCLQSKTRTCSPPSYSLKQIKHLSVVFDNTLPALSSSFNSSPPSTTTRFACASSSLVMLEGLALPKSSANLKKSS